MQTFLPYADFAETARVLDRARLGKQRIENMQIMRALVLPDRGYAHHPVTKQWEGHEYGLALYHAAIIHEWVDVRGYKDAQWKAMQELFYPWIGDQEASLADKWEQEPPKWLGAEEYHESHRSLLIQKNPEFYTPLFPDTPDDLPRMYPYNEERYRD